MCNASRAVDAVAGVADEPSGAAADIRPCGPLVQAGTFGVTRHSSLMARISASVVYSLPAICSVVRRPLLRSRRSPDADIDPSGNATFAARASLRGVSGPISSGVDASLRTVKRPRMTALVRPDV